MTEQDFLDRIDDADDWRPIALALADWLEERGDGRAKGWRWLVNSHHKAYTYPGRDARVQHVWFLEGTIKTAHDLPASIYGYLKNQTIATGGAEYASLPEALSDVAQAAAKWLETQGEPANENTR